MAPQAFKMHVFDPTIALPQTDKPNLEGAAVIPEGIVNPPPPKGAGRDETDCQILKASAFCEAKAGQGHTAARFPPATTCHHLPPSRQNFFGHFCATSTRISNLSGSGRQHVQAKVCDVNEDSALLTSTTILCRKLARAKKCDVNERNQPSLVLAAHVGSWQPSWPQDGLQDLQHGPSKAQGAPHSLPTLPSKHQK